MRCGFCDTLIGSNHTSLFEFLQSAYDFDVDVEVRVNVDIVLIPDFLGDLRRVDANVLVVWYRGTKAEVGYI